jgi:hypothetical protein
LLCADASQAINDSERTCLDLIAKYCSQDQIVQMLGTKPLKMCVSSLSLIRTVIFYLIFLLHIAYKSCFSVFVVPTCHTDFASNSSHATPIIGTLGAFLIWPALLQLYEIVCFLVYAQSLHQHGINPLTELVKWMKEFVTFFFDRQQTKPSSYLQYFVLLS